LRVERVAFNQAELRILEGVFQESLLACGEVIYARNPVSSMQQSIHQVASYKPCAACNDYLHDSASRQYEVACDEGQPR
jgi:hypothetical protein